MKRLLVWVLCIALFASLFSGCAAEGPAKQNEAAEICSFTDDLGRMVQLPENLTRVSPAGSVATMLLSALAPECLVTVSTKLADAQKPYLPARLENLPVTGQMYGGKSQLNLETVLAAAPQIIIDMGDRKDGMTAELDALQAQIGIPVVFLESDLAHMADAFRTLGSLLDRSEQAEQLADFVEKTVHMAQENAVKIPETEKKRVLYTSGPAGLDVNAAGSSQAQVIELIGAVNAAELGAVGSRAGGTAVNFEQLYVMNPDVILFAPGSVFETVGQDSAWQQLRAIAAGTYYEIPGQPYNWMSNPPSMNMLPGVWWLGNLLYPDVYDYNMEQVTKEFYSLFWGVELTDAQVSRLLGENE